MNSTFQTIFGLLGGLAIFIFGMNMMSECLQKAAGEKMKSILSMLTKNPVLGVLAGARATAVLQSSSATTVMAIGFVSSGLMTLPQAISVILGANIGTTMTAQLIAFKISDYIYLIVFIGFLLSFVTKKEKLKNIGQTIFAFGLLFTGIEIMGTVMEPLASSPVFLKMIEQVSHIPVLGVLVGTLMTLVVQSSSATIAVLQNFASQPAADGITSIIGLTGAIPILLGDNIGTTITALLASVGQSKDARRTAAAHCIFNVSGALLFIWLIKPFAALIRWLSPGGAEVDAISRQIANAHTAFNVTMVLIWVPLIWLMVKLVMRIIPDAKGKEEPERQPGFLDRRIISQPAAALELVAREVVNAGKSVHEMLSLAGTAVKEGNARTVEMIREKGRSVQKTYDEIMEYLADLFAAGVLTEEQASQTAGLMYVLSDIERMGSLCCETADAFRKGADGKHAYSREASVDLAKSLEMIQEMYGQAVQALMYGDTVSAEKILEQRNQVMTLDIGMRRAHMERVNQGRCSPAMTAAFTGILHSIDRMGNSCVNMADAAMSGTRFTYFLGGLPG